MSPERLAYWYFRLNGFMTTENFIVHPEQGKQQRTDADLFAVRFAHRTENWVRPMQDDSKVTDCDTLANVIIAEIKKGRCALNGPWTDPAEANMQRVLRAIGCVPPAELEVAAAALYQGGSWSDAHTTVRLFAIGERRHAALPVSAGQQLTWDEIIDFCVERLNAYRSQKSSVGQWAKDGLRLKALAGRRDGPLAIRKAFGLNIPDQTPQGTQP